MAEKSGYQPPPDFVKDNRDSLVDIKLTDSAELWLIQWPNNQPSEFQGQEMSVDLNKDGHLGTLEASSGKTYDVVSYNSQGPDAVVFLSSGSEVKIAGKISRLVSLIHYPEPSELQLQRRNTLSLAQRSSVATSTFSGRPMSTPRGSTPSGRTKSTVTGSSGGRTKSTVTGSSGGRTKSTMTGSVVPPKQSKRKREDEQGRSGNNPAQMSGRGGSAVTSSGSKGHSEERMAKKKRKSEN